MDYNLQEYSVREYFVLTRRFERDNRFLYHYIHCSMSIMKKPVRVMMLRRV